MTLPASPRVSMIIAAHNRPQLLAETLASVRRQSYPVFETIVVDDGSTPAFELAALQAAGGPQVRLERHDQPRRTAGAKNRGIEVARGDLVSFVDDDDLLAPTYVEKAVAAMQRHPELEVLFVGVSWFGRRGPQGEAAYQEAMAKTLLEAHGRTAEPGLVLFGTDIYRALLKSVPMAFQRTVCSPEVFRRVGLYREGCALQDCDWAIRAGRLARCGLLSEGLYLQRDDGQGSASQPDQLERHLRSRIDINERLLEEARRQPVWDGEEVLLRRSVADSWFDLAYHCAHAGKARQGVEALMTSQRVLHMPKRWKLAARIALGAMRPKP